MRDLLFTNFTRYFDVERWSESHCQYYAIGLIRHELDGEEWRFAPNGFAGDYTLSEWEQIDDKLYELNHPEPTLDLSTLQNLMNMRMSALLNLVMDRGQAADNTEVAEVAEEAS